MVYIDGRGQRFDIARKTRRSLSEKFIILSVRRRNNKLSPRTSGLTDFSNIIFGFARNVIHLRGTYVFRRRFAMKILACIRYARRFVKFAANVTKSVFDYRPKSAGRFYEPFSQPIINKLVA